MVVWINFNFHLANIWLSMCKHVAKLVQFNNFLQWRFALGKPKIKHIIEKHNLIHKANSFRPLVFQNMVANEVCHCFMVKCSKDSGRHSIKRNASPVPFCTLFLYNLGVAVSNTL